MLFAAKEKGQGLVEYALILVLIAIVVIIALTALGGRVDLPPFFVPLNKLVFGRNWRAESQILAV